ncbi:MAG: PD-(D/E)XK nuclease family protein [Blastochloris sp.]|nr:PD-(D/E)XK nuclease family protein [Blastochloris sp.]
MSQPCLRMYRLAEDAWEAEVFPWLRARAASALAGESVWVVLPTQAQALWLRQRCLYAGLALIGVKFLTPGSLRKQMCRVLDVETNTMGRESLEFLLRLQALKGSSPQARSVALSPGDCLRALDDLGRAGWTGEETDLGEVPSPVKDWLTILGKSGAWTPALDKKLQHKAMEIRPDSHKIAILVYGWDANLYSEHTLLKAAACVSDSMLVLVPAPRISSHDLDASWVDFLEKLWNTEAEICPASDFISASDTLVERLVRRGEGNGILTPPLLLAGKTAQDQLALVENQLLKWLVEGSAQDRIALVFCGSSPLSLQLTSRLLELEIPFHDEVGHLEYPDMDLQVQRVLADYFLSNGNVYLFLDLLDLLALGKGTWPDSLDARARLYQSFRVSQSQQIRVLLSSVDEKSSALLKRLAELAKTLGDWPQQGEWENLKAAWQKVTNVLHVDLAKLEPLWSRMDDLLTGQVIDGRAFLQYVVAITKTSRHTRDEKANQPFARIVLTTMEQAAQQTWGHVCFLESNEGQWPQSSLENAFLDDALRSDLNGRRSKVHSVLLRSRDQVKLGQSRFLDILENTSGQVALAAQQQNPESPEKVFYPNEWFLQCLMLISSSQEPILKSWERMIQKAPVTLLKKRVTTSSNIINELEHCQRIRSTRLNADLPFDEYLFSYSSSGERAWSVTTLENALQRPATFALKQFFDVESVEAQKFKRSENWILGTLVHEWLRLLVKAKDTSEINTIENNLKKKYLPDIASNSIWWRIIFDQARWAVKSCWGQLTVTSSKDDVQAELPIAGTITTESGLLKLSGRLDLVMRNQSDWSDSTAKIIDFKTGKTDIPSSAQMQRGEGLQFAAYLALANVLGAREVSLLCINPRINFKGVLSLGDLGAALEGLALVATLQHSPVFGMRGSLFNQHKMTEQLPLATVPIEPTILDKKREVQNK